LLNKHSFKRKLDALQDKIGVKAVTGAGYKSPKKYPSINNYINEFGDPFSFFIYRLTKDARFFLKIMKKRYKTIGKSRKYEIFDFSDVIHLPIIELVAGGTMIDSDYFKKEFSSESKKVYFLGQAFQLMCKRSPYLAVTKNDVILHYSSDNLRDYLKKIKWRVKNNTLFSQASGTAGYLGREKHLPIIYRYKKYLYLPYVFSVILPIIDSVVLCVSRRNLYYLIHLPLSFYTSLLIMYYFALSHLNIKQKMKSYDDTVYIEN
jgi:hypothetical protein